MNIANISSLPLSPDSTGAIRRALRSAMLGVQTLGGSIGGAWAGRRPTRPIAVSRRATAASQSADAVVDLSMPAKWPFPPVQPSETEPVDAPPAFTARNCSIGDAKTESVSDQVTLRVMVTDILMVLAWGAIIPGLLWLGAAAGF